MPKGKKLEDLKPPKKVAQCQAQPVMKNRELQVDRRPCARDRIEVDEEIQTDMLMKDVFSKEEVDAIRGTQVERNVIYNQEGTSGMASPLEPASALLPVADVQKKRQGKKKGVDGRRFTVPEVDPNKVLHI